MLAAQTRRFVPRTARGAADLEAAQALRQLCFRPGQAGAPPDRDAFDARCTHILIEEAGTGLLVCCFRLLELRGGFEIGQSYSAQYYDLVALERFGAPMLELGRFCIRPGWSDPDILRVAWAEMTRIVERDGVEMLFGCSSFAGTETGGYRDAFAMLKEKHLAPRRWRPRIKAPDVFAFARRLRGQADKAQALRTMPPLLRTYLRMGGWVSDHAVIDRDLGTLHVFTGLEIGAIPAARVRALRALAG